MISRSDPNTASPASRTFQEIFEQSTCGCCKSDKIRFDVREFEGNLYYKLLCDECHATLDFGQHKTGNTLFVKRFVKDTREPLANRGWYRYKNGAEKPAPEAAPAKAAAPTPAPSTNHTTSKKATPATSCRGAARQRPPIHTSRQWTASALRQLPAARTPGSPGARKTPGGRRRRSAKRKPNIESRWSASPVRRLPATSVSNARHQRMHALVPDWSRQTCRPLGKQGYSRKTNRFPIGPPASRLDHGAPGMTIAEQRAPVNRSRARLDVEKDVDSRAGGFHGRIFTEERPDGADKGWPVLREDRGPRILVIPTLDGVRFNLSFLQLIAYHCKDIHTCIDSGRTENSGHRFTAERNFWLLHHGEH